MTSQLLNRLETSALAQMPYHNSLEAAEVPLIHVDSEVVNGQDTCQTGLLHGIARGLLQPSVPLSSQAAEKLQRQRSSKQHTQQHAGQLLKSLPVELLYDDTGLHLFDQVTKAAATQATMLTSAYSAAFMVSPTIVQLHLVWSLAEHCTHYTLTCIAGWARIVRRLCLPVSLAKRNECTFSQTTRQHTPSSNLHSKSLQTASSHSLPRYALPACRSRTFLSTT